MFPRLFFAAADTVAGHDRLAASSPDLVRRLVLVDVTPGIDDKKAATVAGPLTGPAIFASFDEILAQAITSNPTRSASSLRRGVLHNAVERDDGRWVWRYQRPQKTEGDEAHIPTNFAPLWDDVDMVRVPIMLVRGGAFGSVVDDNHQRAFNS